MVNIYQIIQIKVKVKVSTRTTNASRRDLTPEKRSLGRTHDGGTAINNILPIEDQFYNKNTQIPDYDFFSKNALKDAKSLADIYYKNGFEEVEAKSGIHLGTYKVFVNFIPVADITQLDKNIFDNLKKDSIIINRVHYAPANYLWSACFYANVSIYGSYRRFGESGAKS